MPWFIPASAGNTSSLERSPIRQPVHPRVRGEHLHHLAGVEPLPGSSPRPLGTREVAAVREVHARFIPASAGNTAGKENTELFPTVHPRVRGEHGVQGDWGAVYRGSSPRPRGTRQRHLDRCRRARFIPASAGNTSASRISRRCAAVHPRVRGEHAPTRRYIWPGTGSSPRPRGTRYMAILAGRFSRFIPASAGNTSGARAGA